MTTRTQPKGFRPADAGNDEPETNLTAHTSFGAVVARRYSRRDVLQGGLSAALATLFAAPVLGAFARPAEASGAAMGGLPAAKLGFEAIPIYRGDAVSIARGYTARPFLVAGEPIIGGRVGETGANSVAAFEDCSGGDMEQRIGSHHDGMHFFPSSEAPNHRGVMCLNHEYIDPYKLFPRGAWVAEGPRPGEQIRKGIAAHGVSVVAIERGAEDGNWRIVKSHLNRRITPETPVVFSGPARGSALLRTKYSPDGTRTRGTLNNCANGHTPWNTYLTCEENWASYFAAGKETSRRELRRYAVCEHSDRYGWDQPAIRPGGRYDEPTASETNPDPYRRFACGEELGADTTEDYRNEPNCQGWVVEIDPFDPDSTPVKRTALGRFAHEGCTAAPAREGEPLVFYSGDDAMNQYMFKFVTRERYAATTAGGHMLDSGTLYAARFDADGHGAWLALDLADPVFESAVACAIKDPRSVWPGGHYDDFAGFSDQADVLVNARLAADVAGATPMDRPEWCAIHPQTGEVYLSLTNNENRGAADPSAEEPRPVPPDAANPRLASEFGHIIRWREQDGRHDATRFSWEIFVLCGPPDDSRTLAGEPLDADNMHASPDGLRIDSRGLLWIQTDMGDTQQAKEHARFGNNQLLAADPDSGEIRRFLQGCRGQEITGITATPDERTLFINLQHPGEGSEATPILASTYPDGPRSRGRGRSCMLVINKDDGGVIGT